MRSRATIAILAAGLLGAGSAAAQDRLNMPSYETSTLGNGLTVQLMRHATVPLVTIEMWIEAGAAMDPAGKEGLASLTAEALRKGAGDRDATAFAEAVDFLGADFSTSVDHDRVRIRMDCLSKDLDAAMALFADAVLRPAFDAEEIAKLAAQMGEGVAQAKDNPRNVLGNYHYAHLYGDHPYGKPVDGTETSLPGVTAADAKAFHAGTYGADRAVLSIVGDIDPSAAAAKVASVFGSMPRAAQARVEIAAPAAPTATHVLLVNKNDTPQTWFAIGALGPAYGDPDYAAAELVRTVFGGRFTSWLNTKLRIESGLTYGARHTLGRARVAGPSYMWSFTATETTREAIDMALAQLDRLHDSGLSEEELASAKAYFKGQTPYDYETASDLAGVISTLGFYGIDRSTVDGLFSEVDAVTLEDCRRVAGRWFHRDALVFTTIGVASEVKEILAGYGPLTVRENGDAGFR